ncbi:MAG: hypothetical protein PVG85_05805 [Deltaproteobacteria bacterium]|jgi:hypothetical protein
MEWVNAVVLIGLLVFTLQQKRRLKGLEENLPLRKSKPGSQADMLALHKDILASYREVLAAEKDILASLKEMVDNVKAYRDGPTPRERKGEDSVTEGAVEQKQRKERAEEKSRFEKEVQERAKTIDWYEKEFSVGLDALLELFLHVPLGVRESIISRMPNSVIKKGFQRLSDKGLSSTVKGP